jgi:group I intron endonuclease
MNNFKRPVISGIYIIENLKNGKHYIGSSTDIFRRWAWHLSALRNNSHYNALLQRSFSKYGQENFDFSIIETATLEQLEEIETYWIQKTKSYKDFGGFNMTNTAVVIDAKRRESVRKSNSSRTVTDATRKKMSDSHLGKKFSDDHIKNNLESRARKRLERGGTSQKAVENMTKARREYCRSNPAKNKTGVKGVRWSGDSKSNPWCVRFRVNGKIQDFGYYGDLELASLVSNEIDDYLFLNNTIDRPKSSTKTIITYFKKFYKD